MGWWPFGRKETVDTSVEAMRAEAQSTAPAGPFRMTVEDVFMITGRGAVVTGRVESGRLDVGQQVDVVRAGSVVATTEVTSIEKFRAVVETATPGENVGLLMRGLGKDQLQRGDVVQTRG